MKQIQDFEYQEYVRMKEQKEHMIIEDYSKEKGHNMWAGILISNLFAIMFGLGTFMFTYMFNISIGVCLITSFMGSGLGFYVGMVLEEFGQKQIYDKYYPHEQPKK